MKDNSKEFLIKEFETSWQQLFHIDNRRGTYSSYFNVAFFGVLAFTVKEWMDTSQITPLSALCLTIAYSLLAIMGEIVVQILESERAANVRYRTKINFIRELFLSEDDDEKVKSYLNLKDIGIKTYSGPGDKIEKIGGTL